jgi:hypothetical protein
LEKGLIHDASTWWRAMIEQGARRILIVSVVRPTKIVSRVICVSLSTISSVADYVQSTTVHLIRDFRHERCAFLRLWSPKSANSTAILPRGALPPDTIKSGFERQSVASGVQQ